MRIKNRQAAFWGIACIAILFLGVFALKDDTTKSLVVHTPYDDSEIYVNDIAYAHPNGTLRTHVPRGRHVVIVNKEDYWPWTKVIEVDDATTLTAFLTPKFAIGDDIEPSDPRYTDIFDAVRATTLPTKETKLNSEDGSISIWAEGGNIFAEAQDTTIPEWFCDSHTTCDRQKQVMSLEGSSVNALQFYKGRNDVVIFSRPGAIYVVDIETRGVQNLQQLYVGGTAIQFLPSEDTEHLYVYDGTSLLELRY